MASGGDSIEESGLQQATEISKNVEEPSWTNLPAPVFSRIFAKMGKSFVYTARQVCENWLVHTENEIGLKVILNDKIPGNSEFVQSVKVVQARVANCSESLRDLLLFPNCLTKLILSGTMPSNFNVEILQGFPNLAHLVLRGSVLHSQCIAGCPCPLSVHVQNTSAESTNDTTLENYDPPILPSPLWFRMLRKLEIIMNEFSYPCVLPLAIRLTQPRRAADQEVYLKNVYQTILANTAYLLNNIRSPRLDVVQFYVYPKAGAIPPEQLNWKHKPLQRFLSNHAGTLKELYLPDFEGKNSIRVDDPSTIPTKLRKLQIALSKFIGDREESREQDLLYWKRFLMEQTRLVDVYIIFTDLPRDWIEECISSLFFASKETLHYIDVVIDELEDTIIVNLEHFAFCHKLQILKLSGRDNEIFVRNFSKLPGSLKKIYINNAMLEIPESRFSEKFSALEMLEVRTIAVGAGGNAMDLPQRHARTVELLGEVLKLRKLSMLSLSFDTPLNSVPELHDVMLTIDPYFSPNYPTFHLRLNLGYEMECGWSEETFDEDALKIEYINNRETDGYSFQSRHRNAISVDDEDHRLFIFQTLPFLLDMRGRRPPLENDDEPGEIDLNYSPSNDSFASTDGAVDDDENTSDW